MTTALPIEQRWHAALHLEFSPRGARTVLVRRQHHGPLAVQKTFYPEGPVSHCYLLHPPGGIAAGDHLEIHAQVNGGGHALITTPAAGKFYRSDGAGSISEQHFQLGNDSVLEWLPQENIIFPGCRARQQTIIDVTGSARCIAWEVTCLGRPACGEIFSHGVFQQALQVCRDGRPILIERNQFNGASKLITAPWGMAELPVLGTMIATGGDDAIRDTLRDLLKDQQQSFSVTRCDDLLICRYLGASAQTAYRGFQQAWGLLRPALLGRNACIPRIWLT